MLSRINEVRNELINQKLDALFITNQQNVSYLTGFVGLAPNEREGFLFISPENAYLLTFPTYFGLYEKGGKEFITLNITQNKKLSDHITEILKNENIHTVGFEKENLTVSELDSLKNKLNISFAGSEGIVEKLRIIKNEDELKNIHKAAKITDLAFDFIKTKIYRGVSEKELALELEFFLKKNAGDTAFSPIVAFNENAAIPHYLPDNRQQITDNSLILLDYGAKFNGYCADMTRVVFFGQPKSHWLTIYNTVLQAQKLALDNIEINIAAGLPDKIARDFIKSEGFPEYPHGLGHGVGLAIHEAPRLRIDSKDILRENMVVTVEPGIYIPGNCGVRIEDLVVLKKEGVEILSKSPKLLKELIIL